jgi:hypothetical protein
MTSGCFIKFLMEEFSLLNIFFPVGSSAESYLLHDDYSVENTRGKTSGHLYRLNEQGIPCLCKYLNDDSCNLQLLIF